MQYNIHGDNMPVVICTLDDGESIICEAGAMSWMSPNMQMETKGGGAGKLFGRLVSGESMFQNHYTARGGAGLIAFTSSFPGDILAIEITPSSSRRRPSSPARPALRWRSSSSRSWAPPSSAARAS